MTMTVLSSSIRLAAITVDCTVDYCRFTIDSGPADPDMVCHEERQIV
jgi:hypothetical protein